MSKKIRRENIYCANWEKVLANRGGNNKIEVDVFMLWKLSDGKSWATTGKLRWTEREYGLCMIHMREKVGCNIGTYESDNLHNTGQGKREEWNYLLAF